MLLKIDNNDVLNSEKSFEYEGLCGSEHGVMFDESLMLFFKDNNIDVVEHQLENFVTLRYNDVAVKFPIFLGREGSSYISEHIDFRKGEEVRG